MFDVVAFGLRPRHQRPMLGQFIREIAQRLPEFCNFAGLSFQITEGIHQPPVIGHVHKGPIRMLAVNFSKAPGDLAQQVQAHRLVVDRGAARAIGILDAPYHQLAFRFYALLFQQAQRRMGLGQHESCGDHALGGSVAHQA